jgi:CTP synthase (UTP-ammonia lyase)
MTSNAIAIVGDFDPSNQSHIATDNALEHCSQRFGLAAEHRWIATEELSQPNGTKHLADMRGFWIAPASPYKSMDGALLAIRTARERGIPLLGTCGGFQHLILDYARSVLGFTDAQHEETHPHASQLFISRLACSLVGRTMTITLQPGSLVARAYGGTKVKERYLCNFGVNPNFVNILRPSTLRIVGSDDEGEVRAVELAGHPFFVGTLFLPQLISTPSAPHPLIMAFVRACFHNGVDQPRSAFSKKP